MRNTSTYMCQRTRLVSRAPLQRSGRIRPKAPGPRLLILGCWCKNSFSETGLWPIRDRRLLLALRFLDYVHMLHRTVLGYEARIRGTAVDVLICSFLDRCTA